MGPVGFCVDHRGKAEETADLIYDGLWVFDKILEKDNLELMAVEVLEVPPKGLLVTTPFDDSLRRPLQSGFEVEQCRSISNQVPVVRVGPRDGIPEHDYEFHFGEDLVHASRGVPGGKICGRPLPDYCVRRGIFEQRRVPVSVELEISFIVRKRPTLVRLEKMIGVFVEIVDRKEKNLSAGQIRAGMGVEKCAQ